MRQSSPPLSRTLAIVVAIFVVVALLTATATYREATPGAHLYAAYFKPDQPVFAGTQRALGRDQSAEASVLRQAVSYHRDARYDYALMGFRNYRETNPVPTDPAVPLLAATAALATGHHAEADEWLELVDRDAPEAHAAALWYQALNDLAAERITSARVLLTELADGAYARAYPVAELLAELPIE